MNEHEISSRVAAAARSCCLAGFQPEAWTPTRLRELPLYQATTTTSQRSYVFYSFTFTRRQSISNNSCTKIRKCVCRCVGSSIVWCCAVHSVQFSSAKAKVKFSIWFSFNVILIRVIHSIFINIILLLLFYFGVSSFSCSVFSECSLFCSSCVY